MSDKTATTYRSVFARHGKGPERAVMFGNFREIGPVLPAIEAGLRGLGCRTAKPWALERATPPESHPRYGVIDDLGAAVALVAMLKHNM